MKRVILGPKYAIRLRDLQRWHVLIVKCWRCPRQGLVDPEDLRDRPAIPETMRRETKGDKQMSNVTQLENRRPRSHWTNQIVAAWSDQLEDIFHTGDLIESAKLELPHGEFMKMVKDELPFKRTVAQMLKAIATDDNVRNYQPVGNLPVGYSILYELTRLTDEQFSAATANGMIHPKMTRKDAKTLRGEPEKKPEDPPMTKCAKTVRRAVTNAMRQLPPDEWASLLRQLRGVIDDIDEKEIGDGHHAARQSA